MLNERREQGIIKDNALASLSSDRPPPRSSPAPPGPMSPPQGPMVDCPEAPEPLATKTPTSVNCTEPPEPPALKSPALVNRTEPPEPPASKCPAQKSSAAFPGPPKPPALKSPTDNDSHLAPPKQSKYQHAQPLEEELAHLDLDLQTMDVDIPTLGPLPKIDTPHTNPRHFNHQLRRTGHHEMPRH
ncbi:uncharacterized protein MELLADRAFT_104571 [Melampsora larici-populina 98AG31]|uniref:Uncharacterized protein n=1 Tax=Melampsora larici-populina (strain 98AG31 / pathotype 3-4-7) TaxID=747676 RepID=F4RF58_MELLP|nr:uncharacterized protein MELLADRAFT_104571 [Melampsora larici-populina 98AG31]EGG08993.1 hypothetical protein MELLADRAFT_104571 [Melampsora larici-populina 98AG31]